MSPEAIILLSGKGRPIPLFGNTLMVKADSERTGENYALIEYNIAPHFQGTPLHIQHNEDEAFYILDGVLTFQLGDRRIEAPAGSYIFVPKGLAHAWWNAGDVSARFLVIESPGGVEKCFEEVSQEARARGLPGRGLDEDQLMPLLKPYWDKYGLERIGPPPGRPASK